MEQDPLAKCRLSHSFFPMISAQLLITDPHSPHKSDQEVANKQAWSLLPARASVLHAHSLLASKQDSPVYINVFVRSSEWGGNVHARCSLARRTQPYTFDILHTTNLCNVENPRDDVNIVMTRLCQAASATTVRSCENTRCVSQFVLCTCEVILTPHKEIMIIFCEIWGSYGNENENLSLLGCDTIWFGRCVSAFLWKLLPSSSATYCNDSMKGTQQILSQRQFFFYIYMFWNEPNYHSGPDKK